MLTALCLDRKKTFMDILPFLSSRPVKSLLPARSVGRILSMQVENKFRTIWCLLQPAPCWHYSSCYTFDIVVIHYHCYALLLLYIIAVIHCYCYCFQVAFSDRSYHSCLQFKRQQESFLMIAFCCVSIVFVWYFWFHKLFWFLKYVYVHQRQGEICN